MKTTIELPDSLFAAAKSIAAQRRTTLKAMFEHALRREIAFDAPPERDLAFELNHHGFPVMKNRVGSRVTNEQVYQMMEDEGL